MWKDLPSGILSTFTMFLLCYGVYSLAIVISLPDHTWRQDEKRDYILTGILAILLSMAVNMTFRAT